MTKKLMRDAMIECIYKRMHDDDRIFFLTDDMGAPVLDHLREDFKDRFINVGMAEQNLINVATGLGLEGYTVYAYAISPFFMRAYEQIRINLALSGQMREINVNMIGIGAGVSYDVSGPTHHCLEDIIIIRALPNISVFSPSDWFMAEQFIDYSIQNKKAKYIRLDGKPTVRIYDASASFDWGKGFVEIAKGDRVCVISTGYMTQVALRILENLKSTTTNVGLVDVFMLKPLDEEALFKAVKNYKRIITLEEAFVNKGGLDSLVLRILNSRRSLVELVPMGFNDEYLFKFGSRDFLCCQNNFGEKHIEAAILECV